MSSSPPATTEPTSIVPWRAALREQGGALHAFLPNEEARNRFLRVVAQAVDRNPDLGDPSKCDPASLAAAAVEAASLGLEPSGAAGGAHLVLFGRTAQLIVDYRGQLQLARDSEKVEDAYAVIVRRADHFRYDAANGVIEHEPDMAAPQSPNPELEANPMTHVYAVLVFASGYRRVEVMSKTQVDAVRAMSRAANGPAWTGSYLEMAKKTVMHRILKTAPLRPGARAILERDPDFDFDGTRATVERVVAPRPRLATRLRQKRLGTTQEADAGSRADTGRAEAAGDDGAGTGDPAPESAAASADCDHPKDRHETTATAIVCGVCGTVLAERPAAAEPAAPRPRARSSTKAKGGKTAAAKPKAPLQPGDAGYGTARAHAVAAERGLDHAAVHRIAADVLNVSEEGLEAFSVTTLDEAAWDDVIAAISEAPVADADTIEWAGRMALQAGVGEGDDPWTEGDPLAAAMFDLEDAEKLTFAQWREFGIRVYARNPLP